jgi:signal transduction histidine kinase
MSANPKPQVQNLRFEVDASVVFQLGESLITDDVQALVELIKNSYDADASFSKITVVSKGAPDGRTAYQNAEGYIIVQDDGDGMDLQTIQEGWLFISNSAKREFKRANRVTRKGRTPLGDKGLGRLSTQRLGKNLEMFTKPRGQNVENYVAFSWDAFRQEKKLSSVSARYEALPAATAKGTRLLISDLNTSKSWKGDAVTELEARLSELISPFEPPKEFTVTAVIDGHRLELSEVAERVRRVAQLRFRFEFDGIRLRVGGHVRLDFFRPGVRAPSQEKTTFQELVESDGGKRLAEHLLTQPRASEFNLKPAKSGAWLLDFAFSVALDDVEPSVVDGVPANPGPFHGEIDSFSPDKVAPDSTVFDRTSELRQFLRRLAGIRVYRDGFGIRVDRDWLKLGSQWTSGRSWFALRPENTMGYVTITARDNAALEETTDREGFKAGPHFDNFYALLSSFVQRSGSLMETLGRGMADYKRSRHRERAHVERERTPEDIAGTLALSLGEAYRHEDSVTAVVERLKTAATQVSEANKTMRRSADGSLGPNAKQLAVIIEKVELSVQEAQLALGKVHEYLAEVSSDRDLAELLKSQIGGLREQLERTYEVVGLGLTAEAISHEILNVTDQLAARTRPIVEYLEGQERRDPRLAGYVEHVNGTVSALRKQLTHLAPSLRYVRERRERIELPNFIRELVEYQNERLASSGIDVRLRERDGEFAVSVNRGKLTQIFDNLLLNSEYWLKEDLRLGRIKRGIVTIELASPLVRVSDNGRGIDPSVEDSLFEPFVTTKGRGRGRGLGLFIVRQFLDSEGSSIALSGSRNTFGRLHKFELDLSGMIAT